MHTTAHADPDDPTSMALPVMGDTVLLTDGTTSKIRSRVGNTWKVQDDITDHEHIVTIDQIAGYPDDVAWVRGQFEPEQAPQQPRCPRCGGQNGAHVMVHRRHEQGGGGVNVPCPHAAPLSGIETRQPARTPLQWAEETLSREFAGDLWAGSCTGDVYDVTVKYDFESWRDLAERIGAMAAEHTHSALRAALDVDDLARALRLHVTPHRVIRGMECDCGVLLTEGSTIPWSEYEAAHAAHLGAVVLRHVLGGAL
jgi:hypothetical protein